MLHTLDDWTRDASALCRPERCMQVGNESLQEADKLLKLLAQDFARRLICVPILLHMCPHTAIHVYSSMRTHM